MNGAPVDESDVVDFLASEPGTCESLGATFFEITTALAFDWFSRRSVDVALIETGLGGRLDATNVLSPLAATVVSVALDHTEILGGTIREIALEKAGIFKPARPAIVGEPSAEYASILATAAAGAGANPIVIARDDVDVTEILVSREGTAFTMRVGEERVRVLTPLVGEHQAWNTAIAWLTLRACGEDYAIQVADLTDALRQLTLPGRFQRRENVIFDVAHNPAGAQALAKAILSVNPRGQRTALMAVMADKDWRAMIDVLAPAVDRFFFTVAPGAPDGRIWSPEAAHAYAISRGLAADIDTDFDDALTRAAKRCGTLVITGSFHTVGAAMSRLQVSPFSP